MHSEIHEQPALLRSLLDGNAGPVNDTAAQLAGKEFNYIVIAARGTSDNAARYAKYLWAAHCHKPVALATPALFTRYDMQPDLTGALVVGISQSGESPDLVAVLEAGKHQGRPTLAITNRPESPLATAADLVIDIHAGEETAVAATKTYTAELMAIAMLSSAWNDWELRQELTLLGDYADLVLDKEDEISDAAHSYTHIDSAVVLGRGFNYASAWEWALKLQEVTYVLAHPFSAADFRHGPKALVAPGLPVLAISPAGPVLDETVELLEEMTATRGVRSVVISNSSRALRAANHPIPLPRSTAEWVSPIPAIVAAQLFTWHLARARRLDPDEPRGLSKITRTT